MKALDCMKTRVVTVAPDATLSQALDLMDIYQVNTLPVVDDRGRICGLLGESNLPGMLSIACDEVEYTRLDWRSLSRRSVLEYMTATPITASESQEMQEVARLMILHKLQHLPVTTEEGKFIGLLSYVDMLLALCEGAISDQDTMA